MQSGIPFFNWSLKKLLTEETDVLLKSKYKIVFIFFILFFIKGLVALLTAVYFQQGFHIVRASLFLIICLLLFKSMLNKTISFNAIVHTLITCILIVICTNIFMTAKSINIITLQFVFTLILSSFYILNSRFGIFYSILSIVPIIVSLSIGYQFSTSSDLSSLASPGYEIMIFVNFLTIIYIPYIFQKTFTHTLKEKEALNIRLQTAVQVANDAVKSKSEFLSTMSHELRTPLNTVIGTTDLLLTDTYQPHQVENLKNLKFSADCLLNIINDILDYNKLEFSKLNLESISVNLVKLVDKVCAGLNDPEIVISFSKLKVLAVEPVKQIKKKYYSVLSYGCVMSMKFLSEESDTQAMVANLNAYYGSENVKFDILEKRFDLYYEKKVCAISFDGQNDWKYVELEPTALEDLKSFIPQEILASVQTP